MILFGHQTGNPNSHHAALAHFERGRLAAFVLPWFPGRTTLELLKQLPLTRTMAMRLSRRRFEPLAGAEFVQGRLSEFRRLMVRAAGSSDNRLCYEVNDWLMDTMQREATRRNVTAIHSPEDASLQQFEEAKRRGKACVYDMPIGYYSWWDEKQKQLAHDYAEWVPAGGLPSSRYVRPEQKIKEMELADLVLVACGFVEKTIREFHPDKKIALAPYGVDAEFWSPGEAGEQGAWSREHGARSRERGAWSGERSLHATSDSRLATSPLRFIYAGQSSIRKGIPVLMEAWEKAHLRDAELLLVGSWELAVDRLKRLPAGVRFIGPVGPEKLRELYRESDAFVFPSFFEGFGLVILEAMACGLPVIASDRSAGPDVLDASCGRVVTAGDLEQLVETFRWFGVNRDKLPAMKRAARAKAEVFTWEKYRAAVSEAVAPLV
jgi:glycosyltransferase involved in cell wall biosynthesis